MGFPPHAALLRSIDLDREIVLIVLQAEADKDLAAIDEATALVDQSARELKDAIAQLKLAGIEFDEIPDEEQ